MNGGRGHTDSAETRGKGNPGDSGPEELAHGDSGGNYG